MWSTGQIVLRREVLNDGRSWMSVPVVVVEDRPDLLATYIAEGTPFEFPDGDAAKGCAKDRMSGEGEQQG